MGTPIRFSGVDVDLASRVAVSTTVVASPAAAAETIICSVTLPNGFRAAEQVLLDGWAALTVGTNGTAVRLRIRRTDINGAVVADSGALTGGIAAAALVAQDIAGADATSVATYVLTAQVTGGSAASTVSSARLQAFTV